MDFNPVKRRCPLLILSVLAITLAATLITTLSACAVFKPGPTPTPNPLNGTVTLTSPPAGSVIYASSLYIAGTLSDVPDKALLIRLVKDDQTVIAEVWVGAKTGEWSTEIVHGYSGDPTPVTIQVVPGAAPDAGVLASTQIVFASLADRPEGMFINVNTPEDGTDTGGDDIPVSGTASGIPDNTFTVELTGSSGEILAFQQIQLAGRYPIDEIPWSTALSPGEYRGNAVIKVMVGDEVVKQVAVTITSAAG